MKSQLIVALLAAHMPVWAAAGDASQFGPALGKPMSDPSPAMEPAYIAADGRGLPDGSGDVELGRELFARHCQACHGVNGMGATADALSGAEEPLDSPWAEKTIGSYWPYAPKLFDFVQRSKPMNAPGSFSSEQVYALTAYLLNLNGIVELGMRLDRATLSRIKMPNRDGFVRCYPEPKPGDPAWDDCFP